jgi:hypothetical protein
MYRSLVLMALCTFLGACNRPPPDPETEVRRALADLEEAVEEQSISRIKEHLAASYHDHWGHDKRAVIGQLQLRFLQRRAIHAWSTIRDIELSPDNRSAEVLFFVAVGASPIAGIEALQDLRGDLLRMELHLIRDDDRWVIDRNRWRRARFSELVDPDQRLDVPAPGDE